MLTMNEAPPVAAFENLTLWQSLPPVAPASDSNAWETQQIPVCVYDLRKWSVGRNTSPVSCSGPVAHWDAQHPGYGYCAYHWALRESGTLFSAPPVTNPKYTNKERQRDQEIAENYFHQKREKNAAGYYPSGT